VAVAVSVLTTFTTPYMIRSSAFVYNRIDALLPQKWKDSLVNYSVGIQAVTEMSDWKKLLRFYLINVIIFSVIIITIILLTTRYLVLLFSAYKWGMFITAAITFIILSPFLWALAFRRTQRQAYANIWQKSSQRDPLIALLSTRILLAVFYIGFLFDRLFSPLAALAGVVISFVLLIIFSKKIRVFYRKIETRFLNNYNEREKESDDMKEI
jgi:CPA2 family monovalent cation:H+ antiporter-2